MDIGRLIAMVLSAIALGVIGFLALLRPEVLRHAAVKGTTGTRDIPIARRVWYDWARSRYYIGTVRLLGVVALFISLVLVAAIVGTR